MSERLPRVVVLQPNAAELDLIDRQLPEDCFELVGFTEPEEAMQLIQNARVDCVIADEDLPDGSGLEWLLDVRALDAEASLILLAADTHPLELAIDAINRAGVAKVIPKPWMTEELLEEVQEACAEYRNDTGRARSFHLLSARVRALRANYEDLRRASRPANHSAANNPDEAFAAVKLLLAHLRDLRPDAASACERVAKLAQHCAEELGWPSPEASAVAMAARLHRLAEPRKGESVGDRDERGAAIVASHPALAMVADLLRRVHVPLDENSPRGARLLRILATFDRVESDPTVCESEFARDDPDYPLIAATDQVFAASGDTLCSELVSPVIAHLLPALRGRRERCVTAAELEVDQVLSRSIYGPSGPIVRAGMRLTALALQTIATNAANDAVRFGWVTDAPP